MTDEHTKIMDKYIRNLESINQDAIYYSGERVVNGTRKFSGQAQASIRVGIGAPDTSVVRAAVYARDAISNPKQRSFSQMRSASRRVPLGNIAFVSGALEYFPILEYSLGDLMFNKAASQWQEDVDRAVRNAK